MCLTVPGEFEAVLTLESTAASCKWRVLRVEVLLGANPPQDVQHHDASGTPSAAQAPPIGTGPTSSSTSKQAAAGGASAADVLAIHPSGAQLQYLCRFVQAQVVAARRPLVRLYCVMHRYVVSLALASVARQATSLSRTTWAGRLGVALHAQRYRLRLSYVAVGEREACDV